MNTKISKNMEKFLLMCSDSSEENDKKQEEAHKDSGQEDIGNIKTQKKLLGREDE